MEREKMERVTRRRQPIAASRGESRRITGRKLSAGDARREGIGTRELPAALTAEL